ncbi:MAG: stage II sporulation protein M [Clostridiales bacterium]|nr:stage II sporulation protein M [Clostridiales bacterium]
MHFIGRQYKETWRFIGKDLRWIFLGTIVFFIAFIVLTDLFFNNHPEEMKQVIDTFSATVEEISPDGEISAPHLFLNNLRACAVAVLLGLIPFLFVTALTLIANAAVMGAVGAMYRMTGRSVAVMYLAGILPHGIFELPAILLSISMGLYICYCLVKRICEGRYNRGIVKKALANSLRTFLCLIVPLLAVAALIETYVTPILLTHFI